MSAAASEVCPWDVDSPLKSKRLLMLARLAVQTRAQAIADADRDAGDTNWGIGCKAHERFVHAVTKLAASPEQSWLRVYRDGLSVVSFIDGVDRTRGMCTRHRWSRTAMRLTRGS
jgi:hypothetical protein